MCALWLSQGGTLRTQWVGCRMLQKLQIIIIIMERCMIYIIYMKP